MKKKKEKSSLFPNNGIIRCPVLITQTICRGCWYFVKLAKNLASQCVGPRPRWERRELGDSEVILADEFAFRSGPLAAAAAAAVRSRRLGRALVARPPRRVYT